MEFVVLIKQVPDLAEELEIDASGTDIGRDWLSWVASEWDEYALEEAVQLRDLLGGTVTAMALDTGSVDELLATCLARGADRVVKVGSFDRLPDAHGAAAAFATALASTSHDLILTGVQAVDDLDGQLGPLVGQRLGIPHASVVNHVSADAGARTATVHQEYAGGIVAEFEIDLPAVLGIQTSREAPRYAPVSRVRGLMKSATFETAEGSADGDGGLVIEGMAIPESGGTAEMIPGTPDQVAARIAAILAERGLTKVGA